MQEARGWGQRHSPSAQALQGASCRAGGCGMRRVWRAQAWRAPWLGPAAEGQRLVAREAAAHPACTQKDNKNERKTERQEAAAHLAVNHRVRHVNRYLKGGPGCAGGLQQGAWAEASRERCSMGRTAQHTARHSTSLRCTAQHSAVQHRTAQCGTAQHTFHHMCGSSVLLPATKWGCTASISWHTQQRRGCGQT